MWSIRHGNHKKTESLRNVGRFTVRGFRHEQTKTNQRSNHGGISRPACLPRVCPIARLARRLRLRCYFPHPDFHPTYFLTGDKMTKTFTIKAMRGATYRVVEYWLTRYGKRLASVSVQGTDDVTPIWRLRRRATELGATHVKHDWTGCREKV